MFFDANHHLTKIYGRRFAASPRHTPQATSPLLITATPIFRLDTQQHGHTEVQAGYFAIHDPQGICASGPERPSSLRILFISALDFQFRSLGKSQ